MEVDVSLLLLFLISATEQVTVGGNLTAGNKEEKYPILKIQDCWQRQTWHKQKAEENQMLIYLLGWVVQIVDNPIRVGTILLDGEVYAVHVILTPVCWGTWVLT